MVFSVDPQSDIPVYRQLMEQVRFSIASGQLGPGDALPSTRALSAELGVNPMTISKAYSYLERDGVLERRPGRPLVVRPFDGGQLRGRQEELLRENLAPVVAVVGQLGLDRKRALCIFDEMLAEVLDETEGEEEVE
jgi:GntR family transcriptional regulator